MVCYVVLPVRGIVRTVRGGLLCSGWCWRGYSTSCKGWVVCYVVVLVGDCGVGGWW